jgi:hypothetical protein
MNEKIFKIEDKVYHICYGWGVIIDESISHFAIKFINDDKPILIFETRLLSFTEYTLEGFSQEEPEKSPNQGDVVWVRDDNDDKWDINHFIHYIQNSKYPYIVSPDNDEENIRAFKYLTITNPYANDTKAKSYRAN